MEQPTFKNVVFGGYDKQEVDVYIEMVYNENEKFVKDNARLEEEVEQKELDLKEMEKKLEEKELEKKQAIEKIQDEMKEMQNQFSRMVEENERMYSKVRSVEMSNDFLRRQLVRHEIELPEKEIKPKEEKTTGWVEEDLAEPQEELAEENLDDEIEQFNQRLLNPEAVTEQRSPEPLEEGEMRAVKLPPRPQTNKNNKYMKMLKRMIDF
ncbi:MAG: DivIVA domain-containing protein [Lachnospiraceae bacterium]|nr:DivIVA domain-containing protein [Lachnospiraceae bacterium]MDD3614941.1 DivIVA domain-containing protein [Lachnospiraceae bacterium]